MEVFTSTFKGKDTRYFQVYNQRDRTINMLLVNIHGVKDLNLEILELELKDGQALYFQVIPDSHRRLLF